LSTPGVPRAELTPELLESDFQQMVAELAQRDVVFDAETLDRIREYGLLVVDRSRLLNLVGQADRPRIFTRHIGECLETPLLERARQAGSIADVGSGAGLPGIPLALASQSRVVLVEPRLRKAQFLETAVATLRLGDRVAVYQGTAEGLARTDAGPFDLVYARAVGRLPSIWSWSFPLLRPGGWLVALKGAGELEDEMAAIEEVLPDRVEIAPLEGRPRVAVFLRRPPVDVSRETGAG
jgi:16S rRNA (guanine527-N7)-methyltransferase